MTVSLTRSRVIVGVDGSAAGLAALKWALALARYQGAELIAVRTWQPAADPVPRSLLGRWRGPVLPAHLRHGPRRGRRVPDGEVPEMARVHVMAAFFTVAGGVPDDLPVVIETPEGRPAAVLTRWACRDGDILVVGAQSASRTRARHGLAGPVGRYCLAHASAPVVVVPAAEQPARVPRGIPALRTADAPAASAGSGKECVTFGQGRTALRPVTSVRSAPAAARPTMAPRRGRRL